MRIKLNPELHTLLLDKFQQHNEDGHEISIALGESLQIKCQCGNVLLEIQQEINGRTNIQKISDTCADIRKNLENAAGGVANVLNRSTQKRISGDQSTTKKMHIILPRTDKIDDPLTKLRVRYRKLMRISEVLKKIEELMKEYFAEDAAKIIAACLGYETKQQSYGDIEHLRRLLQGVYDCYEMSEE